MHFNTVPSLNSLIYFATISLIKEVPCFINNCFNLYDSSLSSFVLISTWKTRIFQGSK
jgi:hypothetical protein